MKCFIIYFIFLAESYVPVSAKWMTERCAVCRWVEDWDYNKMIICNRCQIAVHQECYGVNNVQDFTSWVCRACETPDVRRQCCLCLVEGGALKPTDIEPLWVHVTCAWFCPEVGFLNHEKMEPATGILRIPPTSFLKSCVICKQTHGSCTQCSRCPTYFQVMCAARAGHSMELHCLEKSGSQITKKLIYCADHRRFDSQEVDYNYVMVINKGQKSIEYVSVNLVYMDGDPLLEEIFRKEKCSSRSVKNL
ncbi:hypothetical protein EUGRSUZ_F01799 [Eucalyptus grandis]|uniref:PHD-type domain-containing protein n=2 Tax=Eucalyptus grandis TaxID=71139 RepID=A0A059BPK2_EUCGR|nr:hypothetical protein EUGRSUZ_F01799 [Eucalyptus grandis]